MKGFISHSYLVQNQYSYCFRLRVPVDIQLVIGKKELRYSLKTGYLGDARKKAYLFAGLFWKLFDCIRGLKLKNMALPEKEFKELIERCMTYGPGMVNQLWNDIDNPRDAIEWYGKLTAFITRTRLDLLAGDSKHIQGLIDFIGNMEPDLAQIEYGSKQWAELNRRLMLSYIEDLEYEKGQIRAKYPELDNILGQRQDLPDSNKDNRKAEEAPKPDTLISQVVTRFISEEKVTWKPKEEGFVLASMNLLIECIGDVPIQSVTRAKMAQYKEILKKLPPYKDTKQEYKGKSIDELLKMDIQKTLSVERVNKNLLRAGSLFIYAKKHGFYEGDNPATNLQLKSKRSRHEKRAPFTNLELEKLFRSDEYLDDLFDKSYKFWTPILALFHGIRQNEIAGIFLDDIQKSEDDIWFINLTDREHKTDASNRKIPIHLFVLNELNFISYVERLKKSGEEQLFPECTKTKDGGYGKKVSRWFNEQYKIKCGIVSQDARMRDFHSFRATFITRLRYKKVHLRMLKEVVGHSVYLDVTDDYTDPYPLAQLRDDVLSEATFHKELDLSHLKNSKWVVKP